jgi:hypothetical protein
MNLLIASLFAAIATLVLTSVPAVAFPAYADWISKKSGTQVDCAYCHLSVYGPSGSGAGQTGSLSESQSALIHTANSPILNKFGQEIIAKYGYNNVLTNMQVPEKLAAAMSKYDLDGDGVNDGTEMEYGTLADDPLSAPASLVWWINLQRNALFVSVVAISAICAAAGLYGLVRGTHNGDPQQPQTGADSHGAERH